MRKFKDPAVEAVFSEYPAKHRSQLMKLRELVLHTADAVDLPGGILETLKWGEPSYLPNKPRTGTTVRLGKHDDDSVGLYFNCQTMLVETFRSMYGDTLEYSKNRAVLFDLSQPLPGDVVKTCSQMAFRYHLDKIR